MSATAHRDFVDDAVLISHANLPHPHLTTNHDSTHETDGKIKNDVRGARGDRAERFKVNTKDCAKKALAISVGVLAGVITSPVAVIVGAVGLPIQGVMMTREYTAAHKARAMKYGVMHPDLAHYYRIEKEGDQQLKQWGAGELERINKLEKQDEVVGKVMHLSGTVICTPFWLVAGAVAGPIAATFIASGLMLAIVLEED